MYEREIKQQLHELHAQQHETQRRILRYHSDARQASHRDDREEQSLAYVRIIAAERDLAQIQERARVLRRVRLTLLRIR